MTKYIKNTGTLYYRFEPVCEIWNKSSNEKNGRQFNLEIIDCCIRDRNITFNIRTTILGECRHVDGYDVSTDIVRDFEIKFDESEFDFEITKAPCRHKHYSDNEVFCEYIKTFDTSV